MSIFYKALAAVTLATILSSCGQEEEPRNVNPQGQPFVVKCNEPLPEFSLGPQSQPSQEQVASLCSCVWETLGSWEKKTAEAISQGKVDDVSALHMRAFPARFGSTLKNCGGMEL